MIAVVNASGELVSYLLGYMLSDKRALQRLDENDEVQEHLTPLLASDLILAERGLTLLECDEPATEKWRWNVATHACVEHIDYETRITQYRFWDRFTPTELVAIEVAQEMAENPAHRATIRMLKNKLNAVAGDIDLEDPATRTGLEMLAAMSLLGAGRVDAILELKVLP